MAVSMAPARQLEAVGDALAQALPGEEAELLEDHGDVGPGSGHALPVDQHLARVGADQPVHHPQERGLAAARRPEEAQHLALGDVDPLEGREPRLGEALGEVPDDDRGPHRVPRSIGWRARATQVAPGAG
jgi:hypothetical protein